MVSFRICLSNLPKKIAQSLTGKKDLLTNLQPCGLESVTFGDGVKGTVIGSGLLKVPSMPELENVLLVEGLKVNLISISQLCDQNVLWKQKITRQLLSIDLFMNLLHHLVEQLNYLA